MKPVTIEKEAEHEILEALKAERLSAFHVDSTIDGFPDIIVLGPRVCLVEMKFCRSHESRKLSSIMESSQPVFMETARKSGFNNMYLCVATGEDYTLYDTGRILYNSMAGMSLDSLPAILSKATPKQVALFMKEECRGC